MYNWCWSWNSNHLPTSCVELTHWKRPWCWEGLGAGGEGDDRGWDGWMASPTRWTWVWVNSGSWWWAGRPGVLWFMGSERVGHDWATELNWTWVFQIIRSPNGFEFSSFSCWVAFLFLSFPSHLPSASLSLSFLPSFLSFLPFLSFTLLPSLPPSLPSPFFPSYLSSTNNY